ncbi:hypothetical protein ACNKHM_01580 [Shigella sonnei]
MIATNTLFLSINYWRFYCKRGLVWWEWSFVLPDEKVVRLHVPNGRDQRFYHHLDAHWRRWSGEMSEIASAFYVSNWILIATCILINKWLTRETKISVCGNKSARLCRRYHRRLTDWEEFDNCREAWRKCQAC